MRNSRAADVDDGGMLEMICSSYIDQQNDYDFGNFNIAVSKNSGQIASVAVFRLGLSCHTKDDGYFSQMTSSFQQVLW